VCYLDNKYGFISKRGRDNKTLNDAIDLDVMRVLDKKNIFNN
jgi:hypothetical protein